MDFKNIPNILKEFIKYLITQNYSKDTIIMYKNDLITFFHFLKFYKKIRIPVIDFSSTLLLNVKESDVISYLIFLNYSKDNSSVTRYRKLSAIKTFYKWLIRLYPVIENPANNLMNIIRNVRIPKYLSLEQAQNIQKVFNSNNSKNALRNNTIISIFLSTGIRIGELVNIKIADINLNDSTILITKGKGNKSRKVYINKFCKELIIKFLKTKKEINLSEPLFVGRKGNNLGIGAVRAICRNAYKLLGLEDKKLTPHSLRHTSATLIYKYSNKDILIVKEFLGHESLLATEIYTHTDKEIIKNAVESNPLSNFYPSENKVA